MSGVKAQAVRAHWTFLTNHAHVLIALARDPSARVRDIAESVAITERAVQNILADLEEAGVVTRTREGRRSHYAVERSSPLRHPNEAGGTVRDLLALTKRSRKA